jgi:16S rRNA C1402 N4-methylase RsmH
MIWALLAAYLLGGGGLGGSMLTSASVKQLSERTQEVISEPARAEAAQQTLAELRKEVKAFQKTFSKSGKELNKSYKDHAADLNHAMVVLEELNSGWGTSQQRAIDLRFELKDSMTREEWSALFATD